MSRLPPRASIAGLMGVVVAVAVILTAIRAGTTAWAGGSVLVTFALLALAGVGAACGGGATRRWWLGFLVFGVGYLALVAAVGSYRLGPLPTSALADALLKSAGLPVGPGGMGGGMSWSNLRVEPIRRATECLWAVALATVGGGLAVVVFGGSALATTRAVGPGRPGEDAPSRSGKRRPLVRAGAIVLGAGMIAMGLRLAPGPTAGLVQGLTVAAVGLASVGAVAGPGRARAGWLGAALLGGGYLWVVFGEETPDRSNWPRVAADRLVGAVRPWLARVIAQEPPATEAEAVADARIVAALDRPVPMTFPRPTPLRELLDHVRAEARGADDSTLPVYVDPVSLQEAERTLDSEVTIDLTGVPLRTTLRLALAQLELTFVVRGGVLAVVASFEDEPNLHRTLPPRGDPPRVVAHCVLAVLAAAAGWKLGRRMAGPAA